MAGTKKIPLRKCVITQEMRPKKELIRIVRSPEGDVFIDPSSKKSGRGAYISNDASVIKDAQKKGSLSRHLKTKVPDSIYDELLHYHEKGSLT
ncbi:RNA-binding protein [Salipaludibacillus keqinensis]|uniref:RNA-binding protein n=1 Tax=Salipaludibacillus keqinensis TaxID=2045207 RepID=A0A323TF55_9BACI|nr:YlxR family protein [Salipaludibacillus keqinensis]PYZ93106.1 RNA-binding protein [Salipaludibacillus keqinensis]